MKSYIKTITLAAALAVASQSLTHAEAIKREFRSTWLATVWALDWPTSRAATNASATAQKNEMIAYLDKLKEQNYTSIFFQVRSMMDAMYNSSYEPWSSFLTGTRGTAPTYDPLEFVVEECHKRGLECYAWVNPYRFSTGTNWNTPQDQALRNNGQLLTYGSTTVMNPGLQATTTRIVNVCKEIINNYRVDGLVFDDYFYPSGIVETSSAEDYTLWRNSGTSMTIGDWRRDNVNKMVKAVYDMVQANRPDVRFGIGPAGVACTTTAMANKYGVTTCPASSGDWQYTKIYSEPLAWVSSKTIDFISPQIYWKRSATSSPYGPITQWWHTIASKFGIHHYSSMDVSSKYGSDEYIADIDLERQYTQTNSPGFVFYSTKYLNNDGETTGASIASARLTNKTLQPEVTWKPLQARTYQAPANAKKTGNNLTWDAVTDGNRIIRYTVYAVPTNKLISNVTRADGDGIQSEYLIDVSYSNTYEIPSNYSAGYWYAVCVYDGFSHEHPAAFINYPVTETAPKTTLYTPANGSDLEGSINFSWKAVNVTSYTLQIARDNTFTQLTYSINLTTTSANIDAASLGLGTFYWRIVSNKTGANQSVTDPWSFSISTLPTGSHEQGYTIALDDNYYSPHVRNNVQINVLNEWIRSTNINNFTALENGSLNRCFAVRDDGVYIIGRTENKSTASVYLRKLDRATGEHLDDIMLQGGSGLYYPGNNLIKDSSGNLIITNLSLNISTTPLELYLVKNLATGELQKLASLTYTGGGRVDHCSLYGDVTTGNYHVFAPVASSNTVVRWTINNGTPWAGVATTLPSLFPTYAEHLGIAPMVKPVSATDIYVNGSSTAVSKYRWVANSNAVLLDSFNNSPSNVLSNESHNGVTLFNFSGNYYFVSPSEIYSSGNGGYKWDILSTDSNYSYASMQHAWKVPQNGLGEVNSGTYQAQADHIVDTDGTGAHVYLYAPGNGVAAYRLSSVTFTGAVFNESVKPQIIVNGNEIHTTIPADEISVYNLAGAKVATAANTSVVRLSTTPGFYIVKAKFSGNIVAESVRIK